MIKQSSDKNTFADSPTVWTVENITSRLEGNERLKEAAVVTIDT